MPARPCSRLTRRAVLRIWLAVMLGSSQMNKGAPLALATADVMRGQSSSPNCCGSSRRFRSTPPSEAIERTPNSSSGISRENTSHGSPASQALYWAICRASVVLPLPGRPAITVSFRGRMPRTSLSRSARPVPGH